MAEELIQKNKEKFYRGIELEELKKLNLREFSNLVKSRSRRTILRSSEKIENFLKKCARRTEQNKPIRTHDRELVIVPAMVGKIIYIHNGKEYLKVMMTHDMIGHRLGEFSPTRKQAKHTSVGMGASKAPAVPKPVVVKK
jgi:small subunit ribosomal protein S19